METIIAPKTSSSTFRTVVILVTTFCLLGSVVPTVGLRCYRCGEYTDGVGSITPCINYTSQNLQDCPQEHNFYCIKFVSEGSTVRECVDKCIEKETWGTRIYCCNEDGCNSSENQKLSLAAWICSVALFTLRQIASF